MPNRSFTGLVTVAPSASSMNNTRGDPLEAGFAAAAAGGAVDVVVAAGLGSLPPHAAAAATVSPTASHCNVLTCMRESPLRHILHKPSPATGREPTHGGIEHQDPIGDNRGKIRVRPNGQRGETSPRRRTANVTGEDDH